MYLVTGGSGFLGQYLLDTLVEKGERVRSLDILPLPAELTGRAEGIQADILDRDQVMTAARGCEVVVHNAALVPVTRSGTKFWEVNYQGTKNVLEAALENGARKVIFISSSSVYGLPDTSPITESTPLSPFGDYGRSKSAAEGLCREFQERGLDISILRPRTLFGPRRLGILQIVFDRLRRGKSLFILGPGENRFQLLSVYDMASSVYLASTKPCHNEDFNVGASVFGSLREDLETLAAHAGTGSSVISLPQKPAQLALKLQDFLRLGPFVDYHYHIITRDVWFSTEKLQRMLNWEPRYSNQEMLCETYSWYVQHRQKLLAGAGSAHMRGVKGRLLGTMLRFI